MVESPWVVLCAAAVSAVAGFAWLALAMDAHWEQVQGSAEPARLQRTVLRVLGVAGLVASLVLALVADHPTMAALVWVTLLAGAALAVALTLTWRPRALRVLWPWGR